MVLRRSITTQQANVYCPLDGGLEKLSHEAHGHHQVTDIDNRKMGMWVLIASECFLFGTLITNFLLNKSNILPGTPGGIEVFNIEITTFSTFDPFDEFCGNGFCS